MKRNVFTILSLLLCTAVLTCCKPVAAAVDDGPVPFDVARNYFFKNNQQIPASPKISTQEQFSQLFGMATTMGPEGKPTDIDFAKQFVLAVVLPPTDIATEIHPQRVEEKGDSLFYSYDVSLGEQQSFRSQPLSIIILDRDYEGKQVVLVCNQDESSAAALNGK